MNVARLSLLALALVGCPEPVDTETGDTDPVVDPGDPVVVVEGAFMVALGDTAELSANTVNADIETYTWSSSDEAVLTVDAEGLASAVGLGTATVTATGDTSGVAGTLGITVTQEVPYLDAWAASGHADRTAEAFRHWDEDGAVPASCAGCHSSGGFKDRIGADGTAPDSVDSEHPTDSVIACDTCHNDGAAELDHVIFPSGARVDDLGGEARCVTCHQGRSSTDDVDAAIASAGVEDDTVSEDLGFLNIHYYAAGATLFAAQARGGYQYEDQVYDYKFRHVQGVDTCIDCHDPHSLEVRVEVCSDCHEGVSTVEDLRGVRMLASARSDYDGDGDLTEGLAGEISGLQEKLYAAIQAYPAAQGTDAICYSAAAYPYWFIDGDGDGTCSDEEAAYATRYVSWSPRLLRGAYNYQVSLKDPGAFAHNGKYLIQLLHDSINDVNAALSSPVDMSAADRDDPGHFNGAGEAARHWDTDESVSGSCSRCHGGAEGLDFFLEYGIGSTSVAPDNGLECETCHTDIPGWTLRSVDALYFPSGVTLEREGHEDNLCGSCHIGRESKATVDAAIESGRPSFRNVHYLPAASTRYGAEGQVGYEYDTKSYASSWTGHVGGDRCTDCHSPVESGHTFKVTEAFDTCAACHIAAEGPEDIKGSARSGIDYDGDGSSDETLQEEHAGMAAALLTAMQGTAALCYDSHTYPYWFADTNENGVCDGSGEANYGNQFRGWTPALSKAAFNYQLWSKEPGAYAHNFDYMGQLLFDSVEDLGGDTSGMTRP